VNVLSGLYPKSDAGFVIVLSTFPLLERYLRGKHNIPLRHDVSQHPEFYRSLAALFPALDGNNPHGATRAGEFWTVYRHGLLHNGTFRAESKNGNPLPIGALSHDTDHAVTIRQDDDEPPPGNPAPQTSTTRTTTRTVGSFSFYVNPVEFSRQVLNEIDANFAFFERADPPLPVETPFLPIPTGTTPPPGNIALKTSTSR
jgi:hypothetical protein